MKNLDERIKKVLHARGIQNAKQIEEYFSPSISFLRDPFLLPGMQAATKRIKQAIQNKESVVIYGDYDADGVSAAAILYLFLKSKGIDANVFIPNRFEDGYGLSHETIEYISENLFPDLLITVDCGITALAEVELLSELGIDVIVTDHHIPQESLPNAIAVVDPKVPSDYVFDGLCGAGVVLKLVQALGAKVEDYVDIAALATIGDIVPLVDENRVIASCGLAKINSGSCNKGILALKQLVATDKLTAQDVSFKIVPRINSTGRMRDSMLSFQLLVEQDENRVSQFAQEIEKTNTERMSAIADSMKSITANLKNQNLAQKKALVVCSKDFHLGVLGILASRLVGEYSLPAFVFHEGEDGLLKGSCRSANNMDIHEVLVSLSSYCENIGGHRLAAGLSIKKEKFEEFCALLEERVAQKFQTPDEMPKFDFEIEDKDLSIDFAKQIEAMEPTGCGNEALVFAMSTKNCTYKQTSNPKHYQLITKNKKYLICFGGEKYSNLAKSDDSKVIFGVQLDKYNNEFRVKAVVKDIYQASIKKTQEDRVLCAIEDVLLQTDNSNLAMLANKTALLSKTKELTQKSGTLVVARTKEDFDIAQKELGLDGKVYVPTNQQSVVVYAPNGLFAKENLSRYNNVVLLSGTLAERGFWSGVNFFSYPLRCNLSTDRQIFADCFRVFGAQGKHAKNSIHEYVQMVQKHLPHSASQIGFCLCVFAELGLVSVTDSSGNFHVQVSKSNKRQLSESKIYQKVQNKQ